MDDNVGYVKSNEAKILVVGGVLKVIDWTIRTQLVHFVKERVEDCKTQQNEMKLFDLVTV